MNSREKLKKVKIIISKYKHGGASQYLLGSAAFVASVPVSTPYLAGWYGLAWSTTAALGPMKLASQGRQIFSRLPEVR